MENSNLNNIKTNMLQKPENKFYLFKETFEDMKKDKNIQYDINKYENNIKTRQELFNKEDIYAYVKSHALNISKNLNKIIKKYNQDKNKERLFISIDRLVCTYKDKAKKNKKPKMYIFSTELILSFFIKWMDKENKIQELNDFLNFYNTIVNMAIQPKK